MNIAFGHFDDLRTPIRQLNNLSYDMDYLINFIRSLFDMRTYMCCF
jgi:hypothetical protein